LTDVPDLPGYMQPTPSVDEERKATASRPAPEMSDADNRFIEFKGIHKAFGPKVIYQNLNMRIPRGYAFTILGGSGVGKSVMLKMLIGLLRPDEGRIFLEGKDITDLKGDDLAALRRRVAMLFQAGALFDSQNVYANVAYGLHEHFHDSMNEKEVGERVEWALELVGLPGTQTMSPADLSGGMRKRVALARAIALRPEVVLYDEPTTGLDPINTARVNHLIMGLKERLNITSIVVTHDMKSAFTISDRIAMVHGGEIIFSGTAEEAKNCTDPRLANFIAGRAPVKEDVETLLST
jgi:phospholipid/cholesterol/gamma-HCH transport system ATP-binding protein